MTDPIFQLDVEKATARGPDDNKFTRQIFVASFDALWCCKDERKLLESENPYPLTDKQVTETTTWWRTLFHMIRLKGHIKIHNYVERRDFSIEFYDNPAIATLVSYKWNTIGYWYWFTHYFFQCCFCALVLIASLMQ
ncbi:hypothetical protein BGZ58_005332, partial [Dissophora ornata]